MKALTYISLILFVAITISIFGSWIISVTFPELEIRSLLSESGIRWFVGRFTENISHSSLVLLIIFSMTCGVLRESRIIYDLYTFVAGKTTLEYHQRLGLQFSSIILIICSIGIGYLVLAPHAVLLSATGELFPSAFSRGVFPLFCFVMTIIAIVYGYSTHRFADIVNIFTGLCDGIKLFSPFLVIYIIATQLLMSIKYIFVL